MTQPRFILLLMGQLKVLSHKYVHTAYTSTLHIKAMGAAKHCLWYVFTVQLIC